MPIKGKREGIFIIGKDNSNFVISTGNFIENSKKEQLDYTLKKINDLSKAELKTLYFDKLKELKKSESIGTGLGLIDISRTVKKPINYNFFDIDDNKSFFTISMTM